MRIHLDTSFLIQALEPGHRKYSQLEHWLLDGVEIEVSAVAWAEFSCGPVTEAEWQAARRILRQPVSMTVRDAEEAARLFNLAGRRRGSLADCIIAAMAIRAGALLATVDIADFRRFEAAGLEIAPSSESPAGAGE